MPIRKASGVVISATVVIAGPSKTGWWLVATRPIRMNAKAIAIPIGIESAALYHPGALSLAVNVIRVPLLLFRAAGPRNAWYSRPASPTSTRGPDAREPPRRGEARRIRALDRRRRHAGARHGGPR